MSALAKPGRSEPDGTLPGLVQHHVQMFEGLRHAPCGADVPSVAEVKGKQVRNSWKECRLSEKGMAADGGVVRKQAELWKWKYGLAKPELGYESYPEGKRRARHYRASSKQGALEMPPFVCENGAGVSAELLDAMDELLHAAHKLELEYDKTVGPDSEFWLGSDCSSSWCSHDFSIPEEEELDVSPRGVHDRLCWPPRGLKPWESSKFTVCTGIWDAEAALPMEQSGSHGWCEGEFEDSSRASMDGHDNTILANATRDAAAALQHEVDMLMSLRFPSASEESVPSSHEDIGTLCYQKGQRLSQDFPSIGEDQGLIPSSMKLLEFASSVLAQLRDADHLAQELACTQIRGTCKS